jgi:hypothetical protein
MEGFMKYTIEIGLDTMIHTPSFTNWFRHSKADRGWIKNTQTARRSNKPTLGWYVNKKHEV